MANADNAFPIVCHDDTDCILKYERRFTPLINDIVPNQVYKGHQIDWRVNPMAVHEDWVTPDGHFPIEELSIDGNLNNWSETIWRGTRLSSWDNGRLSAIVGDQPPNKDSKPTARFITGDSFIRATAQHCNFADDECWNVRTHAKIESISASQGSTLGGQELKIKGWGFETGVDITVAGIECKVTESSIEEVTCITGYSPSATVDNQE